MRRWTNFLQIAIYLPLAHILALAVEFCSVGPVEAGCFPDLSCLVGKLRHQKVQLSSHNTEQQDLETFQKFQNSPKGETRELGKSCSWALEIRDAQWCLVQETHGFYRCVWLLKAMSQSVFGLIWIDSKFEEQLWDLDDRHCRGEKTDRAPSHDSLFRRGKRQGKKTKNK